MTARKVFIICFVLVFVSIALPAIKIARDYPGRLLYGFPMSFMGDYYTNIFRIRLGQEGVLSYFNAYSDENTPPSIFEPHYNIVGFLSRPFGLTPLQTYELFRIVAIAIYLFAIYGLIVYMLASRLERVLAIIFFTFATSAWGITTLNGVRTMISPLVFPAVYSDYFPIFTRYNTLKAHHFLAHAIIIAIMMLFVHAEQKRRWLILLGLAAFCLSFLHPYLTVYLWGFVIVGTALDILIHRKVPRQLVLKTMIIISVTLPVILYNAYVLMNYFKADIDIYGTFLWVENGIKFYNYLLALGLSLVFALPAVVLRTSWVHLKKRMMLIWAFLPLGMFLLNYIRIPMGPIRLFQSNQFIPLAILGGFVLPRLFRRIRLPVVPCSILFILIFVGYSIPSYAQSFSEFTNPSQFYFYTQNIHYLSVPVYTFLKTHTPKNSLVLAGEHVSMILPVYADNKVIIGHPGTMPDFDTKKAIGVKILAGEYPAADLSVVLKKYRIKYLVFGIENGVFAQTTYRDLPFLKEIYHQENGVSVVEVQL